MLAAARLSSDRLQPGSEQPPGADQEVVAAAVAQLVADGDASAEEARLVLQLTAHTEDQDLAGAARVVLADARGRQQGPVVATD